MPKPHLFAISFLAALSLGAQTPAPPKEPAPDPYPTTEVVAAAIKKAASFYRTHLSFAGGYASSWPRDRSTSGTSDRNSPSLIAIEPPGTPTVGLLMVEAYRCTKDKLYLQAAREVSQAILWTQLASGGWSTEHDYALPKASRWHYRRDLDAGDTERGNRSAHSTLDDDKTQTALLFLLEMAALDESKADTPLRSALEFGLDSLLAAQASSGGWPQGFDGPADPKAPELTASIPKEWPRVWPDLPYTSYMTLNDGNLLSIVQVLDRAHQLDPQSRYLSALKKLGDFQISAQCPPPQPGWAQQYNAKMEPAWARKFEPPCVSGLETFLGIRTLHEIWVITGDDKYLKPIPSALEWLEKSKLPDGQYARFYELGTNKPLYFTKDKYELTFDDTNLPTHYGFKLDDLQQDIDKFKELQTLTREELLAKRQPPTTAKSWLSKAKGAAKKAVTALKDQNKEGVWTDKNHIDSNLFHKHMRALIYYFEAATKTGSLLEELRQK
jgi:PelA/Pel-15E family pectate lyase